MTARTLRGLVLLTALSLGLAACIGIPTGNPARPTTVDQVVASHAPAISSVPSASLVVAIFHVRPPARPAEDLPEGLDAVLVPEGLLLEHPHEKRDPRTREKISFASPNGGLKRVITYAPLPKILRPDEEPSPPLYATLLSEPVAFVSSASEFAIGWTGVGPRVWVRPCRHGLSGRIDLVCENDVLRYRDVWGYPNDEPFGLEPARACLEHAWFAGVDAMFFGDNRPTVLPSDPGREGLTLVVVGGVQ